MLGVVDETRIVVGCITQTQDGRYSLEDLSASLPLDLSAAQVGHGFITGAASTASWALRLSKWMCKVSIGMTGSNSSTANGCGCCPSSADEVL